MASTFGIMISTGNDTQKFTFESTDMKARAKMYELAHTHGIGRVYLFKLKKEGFEFVGSMSGIDTPQNPNIFVDECDLSYGINSKGKIERIPSMSVGCRYMICSNPSWY